MVTRSKQNLFLLASDDFALLLLLMCFKWCGPLGEFQGLVKFNVGCLAQHACMNRLFVVGEERPVQRDCMSHQLQPI